MVGEVEEYFFYYVAMLLQMVSNFGMHKTCCQKSKVLELRINRNVDHPGAQLDYF